MQLGGGAVEHVVDIGVLLSRRRLPSLQSQGWCQNEALVSLTPLVGGKKPQVRSLCFPTFTCKKIEGKPYSVPQKELKGC